MYWMKTHQTKCIANDQIKLKSRIWSFWNGNHFRNMIFFIALKLINLLRKMKSGHANWGEKIIYLFHCIFKEPIVRAETIFNRLCTRNVQTIQISWGIVSFMLLRHEKRRTLSSNGRFRISSYLVVYFDVGNLTIKLKVYETPASKIEMKFFFQSQ